MSVKLTAENANTTLTSIKRHIYGEQGVITSQMKDFLIALAERAYEIKGTKNPRVCGASFVSGTIAHAKRR